MIHPLIAELRRAWLDSGITLAEIATRMGYGAPQPVAQLLNGSVDPRMSTATRLADALGYDLALIPREEPDEVPPHLEPAPSAATIAGVLAIADAPYREGMDPISLEDA